MSLAREASAAVARTFSDVAHAVLRSSPENPSTNLSNPDEWLTDWATGGGVSEAGIRVNERSSMRLLAYYSCVRVLAEGIAFPPLILYRRLKDGGKERATDHPLYRILHDEPNPFMSSFVWRETSQAHITMRGNAYSLIDRGGDGQVRALWPQPPSRVDVRISDDLNNIRYYIGPKRVPFEKEEVLHVPAIGGEGLIGWPPLDALREAIGHGLAKQKYGAEFFSKGARPDGVITSPNPPPKPGVKERMIQSFQDRHRTERSVAVLYGGMKYEAMSIPPDQAQFIESSKLTRRDICSALRVYPFIIGDMEGAPQANAEEQALSHVKHTLMPLGTRWEQELNRKLLTPAERELYFVEFLWDAFLRGDAKTRALFYKTMVMIGVMNRNEARIRENLNPAEGLDEFLTPLNMAGEEGDIEDLDPNKPPRGGGDEED